MNRSLEKPLVRESKPSAIGLLIAGRFAWPSERIPQISRTQLQNLLDDRANCHETNTIYHVCDRLLGDDGLDEEEQERLAREKQMQDDLDAYLERWRGDKAAPSFCSIAYSKTSYRWGFAWGKDSRGRAQNEAAKRCGPGAEILCWSKGTSYCALADGPRSYGGAPGNTAQQAKTAALNYANKVAPGARIVLVIGGNPAKIWQAK